MVTYGVITACVLSFLAMRFLSQSDASLVFNLAVKRDGFVWWQLFSSTLLHGGWLHLIFNMIVLAALGPNVEDKFGHLGFVALYTAGAAASGLAHTAASVAPAVGASGAIAAVTGSYLVLFPSTRIICFAFWITVVGRIAVPAWWFIGFSVAVDLLAGGLGGNTGIAHFAHLGGYALGILGTLVLLKTGILAREPTDLFTILRQKKRRSDIQSAVREQQERVRRQMERAKQTAESPEVRRLLAARSEIARLIGSNELEQAAAAFERFSQDHDVTDPAAGLAPDHQLRIAEHLIATERIEPAAEAFRAFVARHPGHPQAPSAGLMLGLLMVRRLDRPAEAEPFIRASFDRLEPDERELAEQLLLEIRAASPDNQED